MKIEIDGYKTSSGKMPAFEYLEKQPDEVISRTWNKLDFLKKFGLDTMIENQTVKPLRTKPSLYELRIKAANTFYRFTFLLVDRRAYFLDGFKKQKNSTEKKDIERSIRRAKELTEGGKTK